MSFLVEYFHSFVDWVVPIVNQLGYIGIFLAMALESSFVPFPSEVILVPAGILAKKGQMNFAMAAGAGTLGSLFGALINYFLSLTLGRTLLLKYGKYFFLTEDKFQKVELAFNNHSKVATFFGRLIFGIRQWISIPAGLSRMPLGSFCTLTTLGAGVWSVVLVWLGYSLGGGDEAHALAQSKVLGKQIGLWVLAAIVIFIVSYTFWNRLNSKKTNS